jgi:hypothetical protein
MLDLHFELSPVQAQALAQLIKRIPWSSLRESAVDDDEAYAMQDALEQVRGALDEQGFSPR